MNGGLMPGSAVGGFVAYVVGDGHENFTQREDDEHDGDQDETKGSSPPHEDANRNQQKVERHDHGKEVALEEPEAECLLRGYEPHAHGKRQQEHGGVWGMEERSRHGPPPDVKENGKPAQTEKIEGYQEPLEFADVKMNEE